MIKINDDTQTGSQASKIAALETSTSNLASSFTQLNNGLGGRVTSLETSFPAGCNTIMQAVTAKGQTPASNSPSDISTAISNIATGNNFCYITTNNYTSGGHWGNNFTAINIWFESTHMEIRNNGGAGKIKVTCEKYANESSTKEETNTMEFTNYSASSFVNGYLKYINVEFGPGQSNPNYASANNSGYGIYIQAVKDITVFRHTVGMSSSPNPQWFEISKSTIQAGNYISRIAGGIANYPSKQLLYVSGSGYDTNFFYYFYR